MHPPLTHYKARLIDEFIFERILDDLSHEHTLQAMRLRFKIPRYAAEALLDSKLARMKLNI